MSQYWGGAHEIILTIGLGHAPPLFVHIGQELEKRELHWALTDTGVQFCFVQEPGMDSLDPQSFMQKAIPLETNTPETADYKRIIQADLPGVLQKFTDRASGLNTIQLTVPPPPQKV